jgi:hypothetical protein
VPSGAPSGSESPDSRLTAALAENQKLKERYDNAQQLITRQGQELGRLRRQPSQTEQPPQGGYDYEREFATGASDQNALRNMIAANDQRLDLIQYRQENPDWGTFSTDVNGILNDPVRVYEVAAWKPDGFGGVVVDWHGTYRNAHRLVELERLRAGQQSAAVPQAQINEQRDNLRTMATMSGTTAIQQDRELTLADLKGKSAKEIAEIARSMGLVPVNDPPSSLR